LEAAAGDFSLFQHPEDNQWVKLPEEFATREGMFVVRVVGESMNKRIPNGAWCLFKANPAGTRNSKIVLVQHRDINDPDHGGSYTVKRYESEKVLDDGVLVNEKIKLKPETTAFGYMPIFIESPDSDIIIIGEFIAVL
jgi:SOS-response transcriptional repressor LexA